MSLSDREVKAALDAGHIGVTPRPRDDDKTRWSPTTLDLTMDDLIREWLDPTIPGECVKVTPAHPDYSFDEILEKHTREVSCERGFTLTPGAFVLGSTVETIQIHPLCGIGARVEGKSSLARLGLGIHVTAPTIHPGFEGQITLEIWNIGKFGIELKKGMFICQIIFERVYGLPTGAYSGQFQGQRAGKGRRPKRGT